MVIFYFKNIKHKSCTDKIVFGDIPRTMSNLRRSARIADRCAPQFVFKSFDSRIKKATDIYNLVGEALQYQECFAKRTTPWEKQRWNDEQLEAFQIKPEQIDRLFAINYYIDCNKFGRRAYYMVARQKYKGGHVFVELNGVTYDDGFSCSLCTIKAEIFISEDSRYFMNLLARGKCYDQISLIEQSIAEERIHYPYKGCKLDGQEESEILK